MTRERWSHISALFEQALDLPEDQVEAFVAASVPAGDREDIRALLANRGADTLLDGLVRTGSGVRLSGRVPALEAGDRIGAYRIDGEIGQGGSGTVYAATDMQADKGVALKVLPPPADAERARHLLREARLLGRLEHAGIARYLNAGTATRPTDAADALFVAMERVDGVPITEFADTEALSVEECVRLLIQAADAVQHALGRAVLHRDLKPSNVLAGRGDDGAPRAVVVDFGVGRLLDEDGQETTPPTSFRLTPTYAAPEQLRGEPTTAATDVFGLGLLAYELLTGERAFETDGLDFDAAADHMAATPLVRPSERAPEVRRAALRGDLDAVVTKALMLDTSERYENAGAIRDDLQRHLDRQPVSARPRTTRYVASRFARRHALPLTVALVLIGVATAALWQVVRARAVAETEALAADETTAFLIAMLDAGDPFSEIVGNADTLRIGEIVRLAGARLDRDPPSSRRVTARLACTLGGILSSMQELDAADARFEQCFELAGPDTTAWMAVAVRNRSSLRLQQGRYDDALTDARRALAVDRRLTGPASESVALDLSSVGTILMLQTELDSAEAPFRQALALYQRLDGGNGLLTATGLNDLANVLNQAGRSNDAIPLLERSLEIRTRVLGPDHARVAVAVNDLGTAFSNAGRFDEAEPVLRDALARYERIWGVGDLFTVGPMKNLAVVFGRSDRQRLALPLNERALTIRRAALGPDHPLTIGEYSNVAMMYQQTGRLSDALPLFEEGFRRSRAVLGDSNATTIVTALNLAGAYGESGRGDRALALFRRFVPILVDVFPPDHPRVGVAEWMLGDALVTAGRPADALRPLREGVRILDLAFPLDNPQRIGARRSLGLALVQASRRDEGVDVLRQTLAAVRPHLPPDAPARVELELALQRSTR